MSSKRSIFEEVNEAQPAQKAAQPGVIDRGRGGARRAIRLWLMVLFGLVMVIIE